MNLKKKAVELRVRISPTAPPVLHRASLAMSLPALYLSVCVSPTLSIPAFLYPIGTH
jgi:hypothetical protein